MSIKLFILCRKSRIIESKHKNHKRSLMACKLTSFTYIELSSLFMRYKHAIVRNPDKVSMITFIYNHFFFDILDFLQFCKLDIIKMWRDGHKWMISMISAHQNMPQICVNYFCVENNYFILALCYPSKVPVQTLKTNYYLRYCK